ncbi:hypothetical protein VT84_15780 [Gemmata sp. SH-PL17]|uniref:hypothetical protein n=1 Tax=Gemmata sp. SH-PL17 TaxID=1630693 RepID=UPI0006963320|nr:hypothetical protein [Gemmata sp. SH-PL17]AMV25858.1 hypothetical protein VT84_15780 [Gemmata sp. SH-PL17]
MLTTYDIDAVRRFADEVRSQRLECSDEGTFCSDFDQYIHCLATVCEQWLDALENWVYAVFRGRVEFDPAVEHCFKANLKSAAGDARPHVEHGREVESECHSLARLNDLDRSVRRIDSLLKYWISPQRSVTPAARVPINDAAEKEIVEQLQKLVPLPTEWEPSDKRQLRLFRNPPTT